MSTTPVIVNSSGVPIASPIRGDFLIPYIAGAAVTDLVVFVAPFACRLIQAANFYDVTAGGALTAGLKKVSGTDAISSGTDLLSAAFDLNLTARTYRTGALVATQATLTFAAGDRLAIDFTGSAGSIAGNNFTFWFRPA